MKSDELNGSLSGDLLGMWNKTSKKNIFNVSYCTSECCSNTFFPSFRKDKNGYQVSSLLHFDWFIVLYFLQLLNSCGFTTYSEYQVDRVSWKFNSFGILTFDGLQSPLCLSHYTVYRITFLRDDHTICSVWIWLTV